MEIAVYCGEYTRAPLKQAENNRTPILGPTSTRPRSAPGVQSRPQTALSCFPVVFYFDSLYLENANVEGRRPFVLRADMALFTPPSCTRMIRTVVVFTAVYYGSKTHF